MAVVARVAQLQAAGAPQKDVKTTVTSTLARVSVSLSVTSYEAAVVLTHVLPHVFPSMTPPATSSASDSNQAKPPPFVADPMATPTDVIGPADVPNPPPHLGVVLGTVDELLG